MQYVLSVYLFFFIYCSIRFEYFRFFLILFNKPILFSLSLSLSNYSLQISYEFIKFSKKCSFICLFKTSVKELYTNYFHDNTKQKKTYLRFRFGSSAQSYVAVEPPPENLPTFLTTDVLRDPKKR